MPIYEYMAVDKKTSCPKCKDGFETLQQLRDEPLKKCPDCDSPVSKQISAPAVGASQSGFDDRAKNAGFQKLKKISKGEYEKQY